MDETISAVMRELMHHPEFQALEALWRGVFRLVRNVDTDEQLQIHLIDLNREALVADCAGTTSARDRDVYRRLEARAPSAEGGWGVLVAHHAFGADDADIAVLAGLAGVGAALDAPWIAEAHPDLAMGAATEAAAAAWQRLRAAPEARYLGLALPRVILRLPYGAHTEAAERFAFEELGNSDSHGSYLWGNPALFCATLLAQGFTERGAGLAAGSSSVITGLPLHLVKHAGETTTKPCAEVVMSEDDAITLIEAGFIPMCSYRDQDVVRVARIQSIAQPAARLAGRMAG